MAKPEIQSGRRAFVKTGAAAVAGLVIGAAAGYGLAPTPGTTTGPGSTVTTTQTITQAVAAANAIKEAGLGGEGQKYITVTANSQTTFFKPAAKGVALAGKLIGANASFQGSPAVDTKVNVDLLETAISGKVDGIGNCAYEAGFEEISGKILDAGIPYCLFNSDVFKSDPIYKGTRLEAIPFVGQNEFPAGQKLGKIAGASAPKGSEFVIFSPFPGHAWAESRIAGMKQSFAEYGQKVEVIATSGNFDQAISIAGSYIRGHPNTKGVLDTCEMIYQDVQAVRDLGYAPGDLKIFGWNLTPEVLTELKAGYILGTIDQTPFYQGFITILQLWAKRNLAIDPFNFDCGGGVVDATNVDAVMKYSQEEWR